MAPTEFEKLLKEADALAAKGKHQEAQEAYARALEQDPAHPQANRQLIQILMKGEQYADVYRHFTRWAELLIELERYDEAQKVLQEALGAEAIPGKKLSLLDKKGGQAPAMKEELANHAPHLHFLLGSLAYREKRFDEAAAHLNKSLEYNGTSAQVRLFLGLTYLDKGIDEKAKGEFQEVVRLAPENAAMAYEKLADIYARQGKAVQNIVVFLKNAADTYQKKNQHDEALRVYQKILQHEPDNKDVLNRLAEIYVSRGLLPDAVQVYKHLAQIYSQEGLFDRVILLYEKLVEWEPDNVEIRNKIIEMYRTSLKIDPSNLRARHKLIENLIGKGSTEEVIPEFLALITTYTEKGLQDEAVKYTDQLLQLDPGNLKALSVLADLQLKTGNTEAATQAYLTLAARLEESGRNDEAKAVRDRLLTLVPANEEIHLKLGEEAMTRGEDEEAAGHFQEAYQLNPGNLLALTRFGKLLQKRGEKEKAQLVYEKALQQDPQFAPAKEHLTALYEEIGDPDKIRETMEKAVAALLEQANFTGAAPLLRKLVLLFPEEIELRTTYVTTLISAGELEAARPEILLLTRLLVRRELAVKAVELLQAYLSKAPHDLNGRIRLARLAMDLGQASVAVAEHLSLAQRFLEHRLPLKAIEMYRNLIALEPRNFSYHRELGKLLVEERRIEEALAHFLALEEKYEAGHMAKEAKEVLAQILSLDPMNRDAALKLAELSLSEGAPEDALKILGEQAVRVREKGDQRSAIVLYERIGSIHRDLGGKAQALAARMTVADLYFELGNDAEGTALLKETAGELLDLGDFGRYQVCIRTLLGRPHCSERVENALALYREALTALLPRDLAAGLAMADQVLHYLLDRGEIDRLSNFTSAVGSSLPSVREASAFYQKMADMGAQLYRLAEAISYYEKVVELDPKAAEAYLRLGELYLTKDQPEEACRAYLAAAGIFLSSGDVKRAREVAEQIEKGSPRSPTALGQLGDLFSSNSRWDLAVNYYRKALEIDGSFVPALLGLALTHARGGGSGARVAEGGAPEGSSELVALVRVLVPKGGFHEFLEEYRRILKATTGAGRMALVLAGLYRGLGFHEEAVQLYLEAATDSGVFLEAARELSLLFAEQGFLALGIRQLQKALKPEYGDEELLPVRYTLALLYEQGGLLKEAFDLYNEIYALDIRYRDVAERMQALNQRLHEESDHKVVPFPPEGSGSRGERP